MSTARELPLMIRTRATWALFIFCLPVYLLSRKFFGRYLLTISVGIVVALVVILAVVADNTIVRWFLPSGAWFGGWTAKFGLVVLGSLVMNIFEITSRPRDADPILAYSPGVLRTDLWDWALPAWLGTQEWSARLVEPVMFFIAASFVTPHDGFLGGYLALAALASGALGNLLYVQEYGAIKITQDARTVGTKRMGVINGSEQQESFHFTGKMKPTFDERIEEIVPQYKVPARLTDINLPRCYLRIKPEQLELLDAERLAEIFGRKSKFTSGVQEKLCIACPNCEEPYKVPVAAIGAAHAVSEVRF